MKESFVERIKSIYAARDFFDFPHQTVSISKKTQQKLKYKPTHLQKF